jgi:hypothetical protein
VEELALGARPCSGLCHRFLRRVELCL